MTAFRGRVAVRLVFLLVAVVALFFYCLNKESFQGGCWKLAELGEDQPGSADYNSVFKSAVVLASVSFPEFVLLQLNPEVTSPWANYSAVHVAREAYCLFGGRERTRFLVGEDKFVRCAQPRLSQRRPLIGQKVTFVIDEVVQSSLAKYAVSWDYVVYNMVPLAGRDEILLFAKGLVQTKLGAIPAGLECIYGGRIRTKIVESCQENIVCSLPPLVDRASLVGQIVTLGNKDGASVPSVLQFLSSSARISVMQDTRRSLQDPILQSTAQTSITTESRKKYDICACTMVCNGAKFLREWVMYHSFMGVQQFFVYDNNSDDDLDLVIDSLKDYNVSRHLWPWIKTQEAGFSYCAVQAAHSCTWMAFIDVDEFIFPKRFVSDVAEHPSSTSNNFPSEHVTGTRMVTPLQLLIHHYTTVVGNNLGQIRIRCLGFGPSGLLTLPKSGQMVNYLCRVTAAKRTKSIIKLDAMQTSHCHKVHFALLKEGFIDVTVKRSIGAVYHYKYPVWKDFKLKFVHRVATFVTDWWENKSLDSEDRVLGLGTKPEEPSGWRNQFCEVNDTSLRDFILRTFSRRQGLLSWES